MKPRSQIFSLHDEQGFTLIELMVSMIIGLVVSLAAFAILQFTTEDTSRITNRAHVDQTGRVALEKIMLQLHSACVSVNVNPIQPKSTETMIRFVSEASPLNTKGEPTAALSTVRLHEITYTPAGNKGTLTEKSWPSTGTLSNGEYKFNESETPAKTLLLTGVKQTGTTPIFQYYRYYISTDSEPKFGQINPTPMSNTAMAKEETKTENGIKTTTTEAEKVAKVTVSFTLVPEGYETLIAKGGQPVALEDSAVLRFTPSSEEATNTNYPCAQI